MRLRTRIGICTLEDFYLPISGQAIVMEKQMNKVCGADIHKKFLVATIISRDGIKITNRFGVVYVINRKYLYMNNLFSILRE
jgi:hypothetical protein